MGSNYDYVVGNVIVTTPTITYGIMPQGLELA